MSARKAAEAAGTRVSRLLALVPWLLAHSGVTIEEAAAHFGVSVEQMEADLATATFCGPGQFGGELIDIDYFDGEIAVIDAQVLDRPLRLTADEATSLILGLRLLVDLPGVGDPGEVASALAKLEQAIELAVPASVAVNAADASVRTAIDVALADGRAVAVRYAAATGDEITDRTIWPQRVLVVDARASIVAFDERSGATRTFRLDRIVSARVVDGVARPAPSTALPVADAPLPVRLVLGPPARWLAESLDVHDVEETGTGALRVVVDVLDLRWLTRLVLGEGGDVVVESPPEAVAAVHAAARAALTGYGVG